MRLLRAAAGIRDSARGNWCAAGLAFCVALLAVGVVLRIAEYDSEGFLLAVRYVAQWPVLVGASGALATVCALRGWRRRAIAAVVLCLVSGGLWVGSSWKRNVPTPGIGTALRVVYWNAGGPQRRLDAVIRHASGFGADFLAIGEAGSKTDDADGRWRAAFPGHTVLRLRGEMLIATKGIMRNAEYGSLGGKGRYNLVELDFGGRLLRALVVDFDADATRSRRAAFEALRDIVGRHTDLPLVVMGDFNTPADSYLFNLLRSDLRDAWEIAGSGWSETWPVPLPWLRLDHVWISQHAHAVAFLMDWSLLSDHRAQLLDVKIR